METAALSQLSQHFTQLPTRRLASHPNGHVQPFVDLYNIALIAYFHSNCSAGQVVSLKKIAVFISVFFFSWWCIWQTVITVLSGGLIIKDSRGNPQVMRNGHTVAKLNGLLENMAAHIYCSKIKSQVWIACWWIQVKNTCVMYSKQPPCCKTCTEFHVLPLKIEKKAFHSLLWKPWFSTEEKEFQITRVCFFISNIFFDPRYV